MTLKLSNSSNDMTYLLTASGLSPGGSSTVHIYTHTIHRTTQNKQYTQYTHHNLKHMLPQHCKTYNDVLLLINSTRV